MPDNISEIAKYNLDNKTNFYTIDQVRQHQKDLQELANLQADYDAHAEDWKVNPDSYSNLDALKYSGSRPETLEDLYRLKGWKQDAKTTTFAGLGALASVPLASEFATYGALGGAARVGGGFLGSHLGSKGLGLVGNYADSKLGTNFLETTGNVLGGFIGFGLGMGATTPALRRAAVEGLNVGEATNALRSEAFRRQFNNASYSPTPLSIPMFTKTSASRPLDLSKVETESVLKPWRSDPSKTNETTRVYLKGQKDRGYFELVKDNEPGNYSVHFKPTDKNNPNAFTQAEKDLLFQSIADLVPEGGNLSTWGSVSRGGVAGLNRFGNLGFTQTGTRLVTSKPDATRLFVTPPSNPSYVRIPNTPFYREVVPGSRPISEAERIGMPRDLRSRYNLNDADYQKVLTDANDFAKKYGYSEIKDGPEALQQIQDMYRRHNTFARVIGKNDVDVNPKYGLYWGKWGEPEWQAPYLNMSEEARAYHAATKGYPMTLTDRVFVTGNPKAIGNYASSTDDRIFAVRRPVSLGHKPLEWRKRAEFTLEGPKDGYDNPTSSSIFQTGNGSGESWEVFLGTGRLSAKPYTSPTQLSGAFNTPVNVTRPSWLQQQGFKLPRTHLQGDDAVKMFKEYGVANIPENSQLVESLRKYVPEVRERYGLVGNNNITDEEILGSLYKKAFELGGDTAAVNEFGEPLVLFRGDTKRYPALRPKMSPEELATKKGTMDNSLGTLFLGEFPGTKADRFDAIGASRYLNGKYFDVHMPENPWQWRASGTINTSKGIARGEPGYRMFFDSNGGYKDTPIGFIKDKSTKQSPNDLNAFVVRTPAVRDATSEISVLGDDTLIMNSPSKSTYFGTKYKYNPEDYSLIEISTGKNLGELGLEDLYTRMAIADHYSELLKQAKTNREGLLRSNAKSPLRSEHSQYTYFALPNFNIRGAKHLLPYDFRITPQWYSRLIYRKHGGKL